MRGLVVFSGSSHPQFGEQICKRLNISPGKSYLAKFSNNETQVELYESVRGQDVFIVQSGCGHVNDNFMELLIMIQACKTASAKRVTAVIPFFPYSRQVDVPYKSSGAPLAQAPPMTVPSTPISQPSTPLAMEQLNGNPLDAQIRTEIHTKLDHHQAHMFTTPAEPISSGEDGGYRQWVARSGTLVANLLTCAGADHIVTMNLHDPQFQGFFDCPVDNLCSLPTMIRYIQNEVPEYQDAVIVSPDAGGAKRASFVAEKLSMDFALIHKERRSPGTPLKPDLMLVGDVRDKMCILIDDIADTSFTITKAAKMLRENGATKIYALITHAVLSGDAVDRINQSRLDHVIVSNSIPQDEHARTCKKIKTLNVAPIFAEAIRRIHNGERLGQLFDPSYDLF
ncbi:ribose-phosphate pyrophosphokinase [Apophysomyces sp. BC1034]|nr:ribose-phosphate pyrophosphokinase [Apophysomyces sp. BC1015]KAG0176011.1 ribose-phosphate pyrophosphokinase [Apophysomyces sp. BC1021]KAG0189959.1 ribose-phosphate pyrophosphokinase [Apophysomyces sp. BC1034]